MNDFIQMAPFEEKYEFTGEIKRSESCILRRIRAVRDFGDVKKGDIGGWIESTRNLSHYGTCWVYNEAGVGMDARVVDDAQICGESAVYQQATVSGQAVIDGDIHVCGDTTISGSCHFISPHLRLSGVHWSIDGEFRGTGEITDRVIIFLD